MNDLDQNLLTGVGLLCIALPMVLLAVVFSPLLSHCRWHRTGLWLYALGYAMLALGILVEQAGITERVWVYLIADAALVAAPMVILITYALEQRSLFGWWRWLRTRAGR